MNKADPGPEAPALRSRGLSYTYPGEGGRPNVALDGVTLDVRTGERLGILGPNGGGKSTLLKLTLGLLKPTSGTVEVCGLSPERARRRGLVGYVPQRAEAGFDFPLSVRQVVEQGVSRGRSGWRRLDRSARTKIDAALELAGMSALGERPIGSLSGGQRQRVMIARAVAGEPRVLLLDEPTVGVDVEGQQRFGALLERLSARGLTVVVVTHDLRTVAAGCDRVACLRQTLHAHVDPQGLTPEVLAEVFAHDVEPAFGRVHVEAHRAEDCPGPHVHAHASDHGPACAPDDDAGGGSRAHD